MMLTHGPTSLHGAFIHIVCGGKKLEYWYISIYIGRDKFPAPTASSHPVYTTLASGFHTTYLKYFVLFGIRITIYE